MLTTDYKQENVCRLIMVHAIFSTYAYLVKPPLASRFLTQINSYMNVYARAHNKLQAEECVRGDYGVSYLPHLHIFHWTLIHTPILTQTNSYV